MRDRDAWATIRGYVYQVETTIERWLELRPNQLLELERGEDIDTIQKALFSDEEEQARLLEQIKHREESLTIRSPHAIEALASFYEHFSANPELDLRFRYVTNAKVGAERLSPIPNRTPAIKLWNQIQAGEVTADQQAAALAGVRTLLSKAKKPDGLNDQTWANFAAFIAGATADDLLQFIRRVEWKTQAATAGSLRNAIKQALIDRHNALPESAQAIYERLFFYVFNLLANAGRKRLGIDDLQTQLRLPALSAADQRLSENLTILLSEIETRVAALEEDLKLQRQSIQKMDSQLQSLALQVGANVAVDYALGSAQLDLPPLADHTVRRQAVVSRYVELLRSKTWCALHGQVGRGKSYLLRLIAEGGQNPVWIRMDGVDSDKACLRIDEAFSALSATQPTPYRARWYDSVCAGLEEGTMLILDDLPRMRGNDQLSERCVLLARVCARHNIKILSSSPYDLPPQVSQALGDHILLKEEAPPFTDQEIRELFDIYGAPEDFISGKGVDWIAALTEQNPTLLVAAARYLVEHQWDLGAEAFEGMLRGTFAQQVNDQTQLLLRETVPDANDRELLYRLNLVRNAFTNEEVRCVSEVAPVITLPGERLAGVLGLWVQRDSASAYTISPLLSQIGGDNLESEVRRNVHLALGEAVLRKRRLGPFQIIDAVIHFHSGEAFNKAGAVLQKALWAIQYDDNVSDDWGISGLWYNLPLPPQMDLNMRLMLRARQIAVCHKLGKGVDYLLADLDRLLEQAPAEDAAWVVGATLTVGPLRALEDPVRANRYLLMALRALPNAELPGAQRLTFSEEVPPESLIWLNGYGIKTAEELRDWLATVEQFTLEQRLKALEGKPLEHGCLIIATSLWMTELAKPKAGRDWEGVLAALQELSERARNLGFELLWARAINVRIRILGQYNDEIDVAETLAREALATASDNPTVRFVIEEAIGSQFALANRPDEALPWLRAALTEPTEAYAFERLTALLHASRAVGEADGPLALRYTEQAVRLGKQFPTILETDLIRALGEQAVALWLSGDLAAAYTPLRDAVERLLAIEKKDDTWKTLVVLVAHALGYLSTLAKHGRPPATTRDSQPYEAPARGHFLIYNPDVIAYYMEAHDIYLPASLVSFAEGIGRDEEATKWALKAFDIARKSGNQDTMSTLAVLALGYLIREDKFVEALDVARDLGVTTVAVNTLGPTNREYLRHGFDAYSVLGDRPNERWQAAEYYATLLGLVPIMFRISTIRLTDTTRAEAAAKLVAAACREIAQDAAAGGLWNAAAELFEQILTREIDPEEMLARGNQFNTEDERALRAICYIRASLDCAPRRALEIHLAILPFLHDHFRHFVSIYRQTLVPFIESFWRKSFRENRFYFNNLREVDFQLEQAITVRGDNIVQGILRIISIGLGIQIDDTWLNQ